MSAPCGGWRGLPWKLVDGPAAADWEARRIYVDRHDPHPPERVADAVYVEWRVHIAPDLAVAEVERAADLGAHRRCGGDLAAGSEREVGPMNADQPVTPAALRELAGQAEALAAEIAGVHDQLRVDADESTRHAGFRPYEVVGMVKRAAGELGDTASDLARVRGRSTCGADWGACPEHGNTLTSSGGRCWCTAADCGRSWGYDRLGSPCSEPVAFMVRDAEGGGGPMCAGHALSARQQIVGAVVTPLSADDHDPEDTP